jgi:hypothetical protein
LSTYNHTDIATGAGANASTINMPLGALDAAIGNLAGLTTTAKTSAVAALNEVDANADAAEAHVGALAGLTTTAKTSAVAAINELDAQIGAAASASGSIATSIDTDGTLKAGAVDGAAVIVDGVVSAAKLAATATPSVNLVHDPLNRNYAPSAAAQDGARLRWLAGTATRVADSGAVLSGYVSRVGTTISDGKRLWLDEMGIKIGDTMSFAIFALVPTGRSVRATIAWRNAAGASLGAVTGATVPGNDSSVLMTIENQTVPAACTSVHLYIGQVSGSGDVDVYAWYAVKGAKLQTDGLVEGPLDGQRALAEIIAARGSLTTLDARLDVHLAEDGTLKTGFANLAFDPFCLYYDPPSGTPDGRTRWYNAANFSLITPDANNPFGFRTLRLAAAATAGGRGFWLDEMGLKVGDVISVALLARPQAGVTFNLARTWRTAAGGNLGAASVASFTGADVTTLFVAENITIDQATTAYLDFYLSAKATSGYIDIYGWYIVRGAKMPANISPLSLNNGYYAVKTLEAARGSKASLDERLDVALNEDGTLKDLATVTLYSASAIAYGKQFLRSWLAKLAKIRYGDTAQAVIAVLGDSWVDGAHRLTNPLATWLQAEYGDAGAGFVSAIAARVAPTGVTRTIAGTWTDRDHTTTPVGKGPDCGDSNSTDTATPASLVITDTWTDATIHWLQQVNGGSFRYKIDSGGWMTVATAGASDASMATVITGQTNASHVLTIEVSVAGSAGVTLFGVDLKNAQSGVRVHKLGQSGAAASSYTALNATMFQNAITALAPDCVAIVLGTNDDSGNVVPATFQTQMETIATRIRTALPYCDILYLAPAGNGLVAGTYTIADYIPVLRNSAVTNAYAMHDSYLLVGPYAAANARGLYEDTAHINARGGQLLVRSLIESLLYLA